MGLQKLFEGLYGPTPYIDLDLQIARSRVPNAMTLDFPALLDGVIRNNVGVDGIELTVRARLEGDVVVLLPSGQRLPLAEASPRPPDGGEARHRFEVEGFRSGQEVALRWVAPPRPSR